MKKALLLTSFVVLFAVQSMAVIRGTKHDFGALAGYEKAEVCVFCHFPHTPRVDIPLWNKQDPSGTFMLYTTSPPLRTMIGGRGAASIDSISRFCITCHDSITGPGMRISSRPDGITIRRDRITERGAEIGADLTRDHPVNFRYDMVRAFDREFKERAATGLPFFRSLKGGVPGEDFVECATCHNPHGVHGVEKFLRKSNVSSSLCLSCHIK
jgi:predicted CXXCH cytochrome family protein